MEKPPRRYGAEYHDFLDKVQDVFGGATWSDSHAGNIGVMRKNGRKNGKFQFVVIDFGIAGFDRTKLGELLAQKLELCYEG